ncbi:EAL domain-containing protein [Massilia sp. R2A-15]|uniref:EAL domain-containing protein n=1 Tax=Massilia sp. R2A-15 TaxID=3064278 RepID=UPI002734AE36|nr:EAL domain-containing protein [Massilia sp. R2A-15]WLI87811.1 EAL domain-containing protein [Massilia sp. R2A-15]
MKKQAAMALTLVVAAFAVGAPVLLAIHEAERQGRAIETERVLAYARDVLLRTDATAIQVDRGFKLLAAARNGPPCSDANIDLMRQIDLASSYVQAVGYVKDGRIACSSLGHDRKGLPLGAPDFVTANGVAVRKNLRFPFAPRVSFIALERQNHIAIIHKDLPIDTTVNGKDVSLAIYLLGDTAPMTSRHFVDPGWLRKVEPHKAVTFVDGQRLVAVVKSDRFQYAAVAAIPLGDSSAATHDAIQRLVPAGLIAGLALAAAVLLLARIQLSLSAAIRAGLKRNELFLLYQPIVDLQTGAWVGVEALIRWQRPTGEIVDPNIFIPIAEQFGLIEQITERVLTLAAHDTGAFLRRHPGFHVAVNLSATDLHSARLPARLDEFLSLTAAQPRNLVVEITERGLLDVGLAREVLRSLRAKGVRVAIDDFGTGYSSLSYLQTLEVDHLKIDKSFVEAIATEAPTSHVVRHIIKMAKSLKLQLTAEGVETEAQAQFLRQRGVEYAQGWLFGKPMTFAQIERELAARA